MGSENKNNTAGQLREPSPVILLKYNNPNSPKNDPKKAGQAAVIKPSQSQNSLSSNPNDPNFQRGTILTSSRRSATSLSSLGSNQGQPSTLSLVKPKNNNNTSTPSPSSSTSNSKTKKTKNQPTASHQPYPENPIFVS